MGFSRNRIQNSCFLNGLTTEFIIYGILNQIKLALTGIFLEKKLFLSRVINFSRSNTDPPDRMASVDNFLNVRGGLPHALIHNVIIKMSISICAKRESNSLSFSFLESYKAIVVGSLDPEGSHAIS